MRTYFLNLVDLSIRLVEIFKLLFYKWRKETNNQHSGQTRKKEMVKTAFHKHS